MEEIGFEVVERYSVWQKKNVRTVLVNARAKNQTQRSLTAALALAQPYDRVELAGGTYGESIAINAPLELVAAEGEQAVLTGRQSCITVVGGAEVYLANLTVQCKSADRLEAAVVLTAGAAVLYRCTCSSVRITGTATPWLERCTIRQSANGVGVLVQEGGGGTLLECSIQAHDRCGLEVDTRGRLTVRQCTLCADPGAACTVVSVYGTQLAGRKGDADCMPCSSGVEVVGCQIYMTTTAPPPRRKSALGEKENDAVWDDHDDDDAEDVRGSCVALLTGAAPSFTNNEVLEGDVGFLLRGSGPARLSGNHVTQQRRCGMLVYLEDATRGPDSSGAAPTLPTTCDNVFERCAMGVDVRYSRPHRGVVEGAASLHGRRAFHWDPVQRHAAATSRADTVQPHDALVPAMDALDEAVRHGMDGNGAAAVRGADLCFMFEGASRGLETLRRALAQLAEVVLQGYGVELSQRAALEATRGVSSSAPRVALAGESVRAHLARLLDPDLARVEPSDSARTRARAELSRRRGGGVELTRTRFVDCGRCAIRFARHSFGLVEGCEFDGSARHAVVVEDAAHPMLVHCRFRRGNGPSVVVSRFANPFVIGNVFDGGGEVEAQRGAECGVLVREHGRGVVLGNYFTGHVGAAIRVVEGGTSVLAANLVTRNAGHGVVVAGHGSRPLVLFNECTRNRQAQLSLGDESDAVVAGNVVSHGADAGIALTTCSRGTLFRNAVTLQAGDGVVVERDADPVVECNWVGRNRRGGVRCHNNGLGTFVHNCVVDNSCGNVVVCEGAAPVMRANAIRGGPQGGLVVLRDGAGLYEHNDVAENGSANVLVLDCDSRPRLVGNRVRNASSGCGVWCARQGGGVFERNAIYENRQCGVCVTDGADPVYSANLISREAVGVLVEQGGRGRWMRNTVSACYGSGVVVQGAGAPHVTHNTVRQCAMSGILIGHDGSGVVAHNEVYENDVGVQLGTSLGTAQATLRSFFLTQKDDDGARTQRATPTLCVVEHNHIYHNHAGGVLLERRACGTVTENDVHDNDAYGVRAEFDYAAHRARTLLAQRHGATVDSPPLPVVDEGGTVTVCRNRVHHHTAANLLARHFLCGAVALTENDVFDAPVGLSVEGRSRLPLVQGNVIHDCHDGVCVEGGSWVEMVGNHVHHCRHTGIYVSDHGDPVVRDGNTIESCGVCGVLLDAAAAGRFVRCTVRACEVGVIVYCGPTTPLLAPHELAAVANATSATTQFTDSLIECCDTHGVLLISVVNGCPLRGPRLPSSSPTLDDSSVTHWTPHPVTAVPRTVAGESDADEIALCACLARNTIQHHRLFGVYHDAFEHWPVHAFDADFAPVSAQTSGATPTTRPPPRVYGGYERLLGTSPIASTAAHVRRRTARQVTLVDNVICHCSFGVGVGAGCHPFLLRNRVTDNIFVGLLLRHGSALMSQDSHIAHNGIAGVYSVHGAKGQLQGGEVRENNRLCALFTGATCDVVGPTAAFLRPPSARDSSRDESDAQALRRSAMAYEQLTALLQVQRYAGAEAVDFLCGVLCHAQSAGVEDATTAPITCWPAGVGLWLEHGSRTTIRHAVITRHDRAGVVFAQGLRSYGTGAVDATWQTAWHDAAVADALHHRPPLLSPHPVVLLTRHDLCASVSAGPQFSSATLVEICSASFTSVSVDGTAFRSRENSTSVPEPHSVSPRQDAFTDWVQAAVVVDNDLIDNADGVQLLLRHLFTASSTGRGGSTAATSLTSSHTIPPPPPLPLSLAHGGASHPTSSTPLENDNNDLSAGELQAWDVAVVQEKPERAAASVAIVVSDNRLRNNACCGVRCQHVVEVECGAVYATAATLRAALDGVDDSSARHPRASPLSLVFDPNPTRVVHALLRGNTFAAHGATSYQLEVCSRYVAVTEDRERTVVPYLDPAADVAPSRVALVASLLQRPPPGLLLCEDNAFVESARGVRVWGYVGAHSVRFQRNTFRNMTEHAVYVDGPLACATVGGGNVFDGNAVGVEFGAVSTSMASRLVTTDVAAMRQLRTRVFDNTFANSRQVAVRLAPAVSAAHHVLLYRNTFRAHAAGTAALRLTGPTLRVLVAENHFCHNHTPLRVCAEAGAGAPQETWWVVLARNHFSHN